MTLESYARLAADFAEALGHDISDDGAMVMLNGTNLRPLKDDCGDRLMVRVETLLNDLNQVLAMAETYLTRKSFQQWMLVPANHGYRFRIMLDRYRTVSGFGLTKQIAVMQACLKLHHKFFAPSEVQFHVESLEVPSA